ncbi:hypothetical protein CO154_00910 [Candidatus Pacearchaeota archaeon CG_4_9_14_3_um_filter_31_7]|nr:MAG: hypothetical protein AUJ10_03430 [Candidatus Pacearchaeota archaeon CG1_02_31_27]PIN92459.1 MAG: hypothetical protein COU55_01495 [Candidatus Pacearchaeota archaeon CG10_big_fil_rev_8_21_14_0_10_31_59]PIZ81044.1 MAG: hypothetical protein COX99_01195 [Candidatus Pacearchaeota archaeon CG_4_10_14_0_2_um_filter_31_10]PJA70811.1 MAG: hypothetical protein CO154_00910 [Candidatus Pacearchaeota archaeon CG_4_9_14_3_um_filter_31_7]
MAIEKKPYREFIGKTVVTKEGRRLGLVKDISFETKTGELIQLLLTNPTPYTVNLGLDKGKDITIPFNSIIAVGDFVVVSEEDIV